MQVFKAFFKTAQKNLTVVTIYFFVFVVLAVIMTFSATDTSTSNFKTVALDVSIIDEDHSDASNALTDYLDSIHNLLPLKNEKEVLLDNLFYENTDYILILPEGFEENLLAGKTENLFQTVQIPGVYNSAFVDEQISSYLKTAQMYLAGGYTLTDALEKTQSSLNNATDNVHIIDFEKEETDSAMTGIMYFYQFLPYAFMSMILCGLTPILTTFWKKDISRRMACSSLSLSSQNLQLGLASVLYCVTNWLLFVLCSSLIYGGDLFSEKGLLCILNSVLILPLSVSLTLIISCFSVSLNAVNMISNVLCLGMSFLCGIFVPQQQLGEGVLAVAKYLPLYWYVKNNDMISGFSQEAFSYPAYWRNIGIQFLFVLAFFSIALVATKLHNSKHKA